MCAQSIRWAALVGLVKTMCFGEDEQRRTETEEWRRNKRAELTWYTTELKRIENDLDQLEPC